MLKAIQEFDRAVLLAVNGTHTPFLDAAMSFASARQVWFPAYAALIVWLVYLFRHRALPLLLLVLSAVGLADVVSSKGFKPYFGRLRPCHDPELSSYLHLANGCGGQFGFLSSHAANTFALAVFLWLVVPRRRSLRWVCWVVAGWALVVSYSRMYLGAHYLTDVLGGATIGSLLGAGAAWVFHRLAGRWGASHP
jgi:undecaprenyl-diphosphatase